MMSFNAANDPGTPFQADSVIAAGARTAPPNGQTINQNAVNLVAGGKYRIAVFTAQSGTIDVANPASLSLFIGGAQIVANLPSVDKAMEVVIDQVTAPNSGLLTVQASAAFAAASIVAAVVVATRIG